MKLWQKIQEKFGGHSWWLPLAAAYLLLNLLSIDDGGTNARARFATLRAMTDHFTFRIDGYEDWTEDWARTPDGHYYANKAPGPTIAAFPVFFVIDQALKPIQEKQPDEKGRRQAPRGIHKVAIAFLFQLLPFLFATLFSLSLYRASVPRVGYALALLAILFGNTAAALMNSYTGNPFAGMAMLALAAAYLQGRLGWSSFFFGWMVLADYVTAALVIPFAALVLAEWRTRGPKSIFTSIVAGAALPGALWIWYHTLAFGGPFRLPMQFEMMAVVGTVKDSGTIWGGLTSWLPNPQYLYELILGPSRGLLFTQPWVLVVAALGLGSLSKWESPRLRRLFLFSLASLSILLWLNAGFPGWHGGGSPGPRYLAAALPLFGIFVPIVYANGSMATRALLGITVLVAVVFRGLVFATWILPPAVPLWPYFLEAIGASTRASVELAVYAVVMLVAGWFTYRPVRKLSRI